MPSRAESWSPGYRAGRDGSRRRADRPAATEGKASSEAALPRAPGRDRARRARRRQSPPKASAAPTARNLDQSRWRTATPRFAHQQRQAGGAAGGPSTIFRQKAAGGDEPSAPAGGVVVRARSPASRRPAEGHENQRDDHGNPPTACRSRRRRLTARLGWLTVKGAPIEPSTGMAKPRALAGEVGEPGDWASRCRVASP